MSDNILLVTIDSLRADYVSKDHAATPNHCELADEATVYSNAFSQGPFTTFSMPSLFTSRYPSGLGYLEFSESTVGVYIDDEPTLPRVLKARGYETAGFHSNPLLSNLFGFDRGFDTFEARLPFSGTDRLPGRAKILTDKAFRLFRKHPYLPAEKVNERAIKWLDSREGSDPFFLWVHYMDVHGPYIAKEGNHYLNKFRGERLWRKAVKTPDELDDEERERLRELYREEVEYTDARLGELFDEIRARGLWDETVVTVTADHGEGFGEHGTFSHPHELYDELTHVPLLVRDPERGPRDVEDPVELIDVAPTLVEHAGGSYPESFSGEPLPRTDDGDETIAISEADIVPEYNGSVRTERYRYIRNNVKGREELFDVREDPRQQHDLSAKRVEVREVLATILDEHLTDPGREVGPDRDITLAEIQDAEVQDRLQDLGYLE
jgi:arylsulfatase